MAAREHHEQALPEHHTLPIRPLERADTYPLAGLKADVRASEGKIESGQTLNNSQQAESISGQDCGSPNTAPLDSHFYRERWQEPPYPADPRDARVSINYHFMRHAAQRFDSNNDLYPLGIENGLEIGHASNVIQSGVTMIVQRRR
jgi:hypothetical protein